MDSDTKFSGIRHVSGVRNELNNVEGLPFSDVLSSEKVSAAIVRHGVAYRERFFLPTSPSLHFYLRSLLRINPVSRR